MELKPLQFATAVSLISMLLLLTIGGQGTAAAGDECSVVSRSKTFKGDCQSRVLCVAKCRGEGHTAGYCFKDVADPGHRVCLCTKPCPPEPAAATTTTATSRENMV